MGGMVGLGSEQNWVFFLVLNTVQMVFTCKNEVLFPLSMLLADRIIIMRNDPCNAHAVDADRVAFVVFE